MTRSTAITLNAVGLYAVALVLAVAFAAQLWLHELPCPLCLLQRVQFAMLAIGPILNIRFGPRPSHYGVSLLAALLGAAVAARQIFLHILPGDPGFGSALFGYHYYTWAFIGFTAAIVLIALMLLFDRPFERARQTGARTDRRLRARRSLAGDRAHRAQRALDRAGVRLPGVPGRSEGIRAAQALAVIGLRAGRRYADRLWRDQSGLDEGEEIGIDHVGMVVHMPCGNFS